VPRPRAGLDPLGQPPFGAYLEVYGDGGVAGERPQDGAKTALGQECRVDAVGDFAERP
jgi:hypothetical protein